MESKTQKSQNKNWNYICDRCVDTKNELNDNFSIDRYIKNERRKHDVYIPNSENTGFGFNKNINIQERCTSF